jgi:hypothetical protein
MSIQPISTTATSQSTNSEPLLRQVTPRIVDSLSTHPQTVRTAPSANNARSPLAKVCDFLNCINYFLLSAFHKIQRFFCPCLSKVTHSTPVASPTVILPPTSTTPPPLQDPPASSLPSSPPTEHAEESEDLAFKNLALSEADKQNITYIVNTLARVIFLPTEELRRRGDTIRHVHPFIFWEYVLNQQSLAEDMKVIKTRYSGIIWGQFTEDCIQKLQAMDEASLLAPHVNAFARSIQRDPRELRDLLSVSWLDFLNSLIDLRPQALAPIAPGVSSIRRDRDSDSTATTASVGTAGGGPSLMLPIGDHPAASTGLIGTARLGEPQPMGRVFSPQSSSPNRAPAQKTIASLTITSAQKVMLTRLLTDISENYSFVLGLKVTFLRNDWRALQDVHPLRLLWEVFSNPSHIAKLDRILKSHLKRTHFLDDFAFTLKNGAMRVVDLHSYFEAFKTGMSIPAYSLERLRGGGRDEWRQLIKHLHSIKTFAALETTFSG